MVMYLRRKGFSWEDIIKIAGHIMGSVARSIMEGSSAMALVKDLVETVARHHGSGHD